MAKRRTKSDLQLEIDKLKHRIEELEVIPGTHSSNEFNILDYLVEQIVYIDSSMRILRANYVACTSAGLTADQIIGQYCYKVLAQRDDICSGCPVAMAMATGKLQEKEMTAPDGRNWFIRGFPVLDKDGGIIGAVELAKETTSEIKARDKLRESEEKYRTLIESSNDSIFIIIDGKIQYANRELIRISGYPREQLIGKSFLEFVASEEREKVTDYYLQRVAGENVPNMYESVAVTRSGKNIPVEVSVIPIQFQGRSAEQVICRDISEYKKIEQRYKEITRNFRDALDRSPDGVIIADSEGKTLYVNHRLSEILEYSTDECLELTISDLTPARDLVKYKKMYNDRLQGKPVPRIYQRTVITKSGKEIPVEMRTTTTLWEDKVCELAFMTDITKRKEAEDLLRQREQENRFQANIIQDSPLIAAFHDKELNTLWVNKAYEEATGLSLEEIKGRKCYNIWNLEKPCRGCPVIKAIETGEKASNELTPENQDHWPESQGSWLSRAAPVKGEDDEVIGAVEFAIDITESKRVENALKESERRMITLMGNLPGMVYSCRNIPEWTMTFVSQGCYGLTGYEPEELINDRVICYNDLIHPDDRNMVWKTVQKAVKKGVNFELEYRIISKDSSVKWVWERGRCVSSGTAEQELLEGFISNITKRKKAEEIHRILYDINLAVNNTDDLDELYHELHEYVGRIINVDNIYIAIVNQENNTIEFPYYIDKMDEKPDPVPLEESCGLTAYVMETGNPILVDRNTINELEKEGKVKISGSMPEKWLGIPLMTSGRIIGILALQSYDNEAAFDTNDLNFLKLVSNDIASAISRKNFLDKLSKSEEFNRSIIENSMDCIKILDLEGNLEFMSKGGQKLLEIEDIDLYLNKSWLDFWKDEDFENARNAIEQAKKSKVGYFEGFSPTSSGESKWWGVQISPLYDIDGAVDRLLAVSRDITIRKELESKYLQAQKMESIGRLAGGVAHDLNNTLSVIIGYSELMMNKMSDDDENKSDVQEIVKAAEQSTAIIGQLMAFTRQQTIAPSVLDLNRTVSEMINMLKGFIGENIELAWNPAEYMITVRMDPSQIGQILTNLIVNARDAITDVGRIAIKTENVLLDDEFCYKHPGSVPGRFVCLSCSDDGCGMDRNTQKQIFEPFFTTKAIGKGSGLGLSTVYGIVKQNDGYVSVYSEQGYGTTFNIYLPRVGGEAPVTEKAAEIDIPSSHGETVLVVEDEISILQITERMLNILGYNVLMASTPQEAIRLGEIYSGSIDLLITDIIMPDMNGRDLANLLHSRNPEIKILFMSGYTANAIVHQGILDKGVRFLKKPFTIKELEQKVSFVLNE